MTQGWVNTPGSGGLIGLVSSPWKRRGTSGFDGFVARGENPQKPIPTRRLPFLTAISGNWLGAMYEWMLQYGNKTRRGGELRPGLPMSQRYAKNTLIVLVRALKDMGYIRRGRSGRLVPIRSPSQIFIPRIEAYMRKRFPGGDMTLWSPSSHGNYTCAFRKMAEFLYYGRKEWSKTKMRSLRQRLPFLHSDYHELDINPPQAAMAFCEWLWRSDHYQAKVDSIILFLGQHLAMRYSEAVGASTGLNDADQFTLKIDFRHSRTWIRGKGRGGMGKKQEGPPLAEPVARRLKDYLQWREGFLSSRHMNDGDSRYLVFVRSPQRTIKEGREVFTRMGLRSGRLNVRLKEYAPLYNEEFSLPPMSDRYVEPGLAKSHSLGRHVYGTFWARRIHPKTLIQYMRISDRNGEGWAVVRKYINFDRTSEAREYNRLATTLLI